MLFNIDLSQLSKPCIGEIAKQSKSASELDSIAQYAIENEDTLEAKGPYEDEACIYLDEVIKNEYLSDDTVERLIRYQGSVDLHMGIIQDRKLNSKQIDLMIKFVTDLSMITFMRDKQSMELSKEQWDTIANRIMSGEICVRDCYNYFYSWEVESVDEEIRRIAEECTEPVGEKLLNWWQNSVRKAFFDYEACFSLRNCLNNQVFHGFDTADMTEEIADHVAACILHAFFQLENCRDSENDAERSIDDVVLAIVKKCSSNYSTRLHIWRSDRQREAKRVFK